MEQEELQKGKKGYQCEKARDICKSIIQDIFWKRKNVFVSLWNIFENTRLFCIWARFKESHSKRQTGKQLAYLAVLFDKNDLEYVIQIRKIYTRDLLTSEVLKDKFAQFQIL